MHYTRVKGILSANNGMNLYRGCTHGCIYCDSRSTCYQIQHDFEDIEVKENALILLENNLKHKKRKSMIATGSMSDPYMPLEATLQYTRKALSIISRYHFGCTLITKSDLVLRDLDLICEIHKKSKCVIQMTLTTYDDCLCKILEPNVCPTSKRIETLNILKDHHIPTIVWLCPILPFINDTKENLIGILNACIQAKVKGIICFGMGVTLREGNREYFYKKLDEHFPHLKEKYIHYYGNQYMIASFHHQQLMKLFHQICEENGIMHDNDQIFKYLHTYTSPQNIQQLSLF